jgi:hypothetical protein
MCDLQIEQASILQYSVLQLFEIVLRIVKPKTTQPIRLAFSIVQFSKDAPLRALPLILRMKKFLCVPLVLGFDFAMPDEMSSLRGKRGARGSHLGLQRLVDQCREATYKST